MTPGPRRRNGFSRPEALLDPHPATHPTLKVRHGSQASCKQPTAIAQSQKRAVTRRQLLSSWRAAEDALRENRQQHPRQWEDFDQLRARLDKIEAASGEARPTTGKDLHDFLTDESRLVVDEPHRSPEPK